MNRYIALTAAALALTVASSASASEMIVKIVGKSTPQVYTEIVEAAHTVCTNDLRFNSLADEMQPFCVREAVREAVAQAKNPELVSYSRTQRIARVMATASR
jgi:hypothetical protein